MAGQRTLNPYVLVRLQCTQPEIEEICKGLLFFLQNQKFEHARSRKCFLRLYNLDHD